MGSAWGPLLVPGSLQKSPPQSVLAWLEGLAWELALVSELAWVPQRWVILPPARVRSTSVLLAPGWIGACPSTAAWVPAQGRVWMRRDLRPTRAWLLVFLGLLVFQLLLVFRWILVCSRALIGPARRFRQVVASGMDPAAVPAAHGVVAALLVLVWALGCCLKERSLQTSRAQGCLVQGCFEQDCLAQDSRAQGFFALGCPLQQLCPVL